MSTIRDRFVSITDLKKNTSKHIAGLRYDKEKFILVNNAPQAVLLDISVYESLIGSHSSDAPVELNFVPLSELTSSQLRALQKAKNAPDSDFVNI